MIFGPSAASAVRSAEGLLLGRVESVTDRLRGWRRDAEDAEDAWCHRCGGDVGAGEAADDGCSACRGKKLAWERAVRLGAYEGVLADAVLGLKFHGERSAGRVLGRLLGEAIGVVLRSQDIAADAAVIVPVPTTHRRRLLRGRGVDHTAVLAVAAAETSGVSVLEMLARKHGPSQTRLSGAERRRAVTRNDFRVLKGLGVDGVRVVIVVDDVRTTGATMSGCCRSLRAALVAADQPGTIGGDRVGLWAATAAVSRDRRRAAVGRGGAEK